MRLGEHAATTQRLRAATVLVLTAGTGPVLALVAWPLLRPALADRDGPAALADLVACACAVLALVAWAWLALGVCACWRSTGQGAPSPPSWAPRLAHVLVAAALGVTLPALDATAAPSSTHTTDLLRGLQLPDRAVGTIAPRSPGHVREQRTVHVRVGDCLWDLAEAHLPRAASPQAVDRAWRSLYRTNRSRIGSDPDLLRPGTELVLPATLDRAPRAGGQS